MMKRDKIHWDDVEVGDIIKFKHRNILSTALYKGIITLINYQKIEFYSTKLGLKIFDAQNYELLRCVKFQTTHNSPCEEDHDIST